MRLRIIFATLISYYVLPAEAPLTKMFSNLFQGDEHAAASLPREYPSLVLMLLTNGECIVAPFTIKGILKELKSDGLTGNIKLLGTKFLFVCPAENAKEEEIVKNSSVTKKLLFFRDEYEIKANTDEQNEMEPRQTGDVGARSVPTEGTQEVNPVESNMETTSKSNVADDYENKYKCVTPIKASIVNITELGPTPNSPNQYFVTGFEVYMEKYHYLSTSTPMYLMQVLKENILWLGVLSIKFDRFRLDVKFVSYCEITRHREFPTIDSDSPVTATDYELGKTLLYGNLDIEKLYRIDNQRNVFSRLFPNESKRSIYFDETSKFLVEAHLAPLNTTLKGLQQLAVQTYGNIAPMWQTVKSYSWSRLEKFIDKLTKDLDGLHVVTGTYEILNLASTGPIYLSETNQVSVPLAFYKIVETQNLQAESFTIVIVVVNNPHEETGTKLLCEVNECQKYGWSLLENSDYTKGETYCCPLTEGIINELRLPDTVNIGEVLNLNDFVSLSEYVGIFEN